MTTKIHNYFTQLLAQTNQLLNQELSALKGFQTEIHRLTRDICREEMQLAHLTVDCKKDLTSMAKRTLKMYIALYNLNQLPFKKPRYIGSIRKRIIDEIKESARLCPTEVLKLYYQRRFFYMLTYYGHQKTEEQYRPLKRFNRSTTANFEALSLQLLRYSTLEDSRLDGDFNDAFSASISHLKDETAKLKLVDLKNLLLDSKTKSTTEIIDAFNGLLQATDNASYFPSLSLFRRLAEESKHAMSKHFHWGSQQYIDATKRFTVKYTLRHEKIASQLDQIAALPMEKTLNDPKLLQTLNEQLAEFPKPLRQTYRQILQYGYDKSILPKKQRAHVDELLETLQQDGSIHSISNFKYQKSYNHFSNEPLETRLDHAIRQNAVNIVKQFNHSSTILKKNLQNKKETRSVLMRAIDTACKNSLDRLKSQVHAAATRYIQKKLSTIPKLYYWIQCDQKSARQFLQEIEHCDNYVDALTLIKSRLNEKKTYRDHTLEVYLMKELFNAKDGIFNAEMPYLFSKYRRQLRMRSIATSPTPNGRLVNALNKPCGALTGFFWGGTKERLALRQAAIIEAEKHQEKFLHVI